VIPCFFIFVCCFLSLAHISACLQSGKRIYIVWLFDFNLKDKEAPEGPRRSLFLSWEPSAGEGKQHSFRLDVDARPQALRMLPCLRHVGFLFPFASCVVFTVVSMLLVRFVGQNTGWYPQPKLHLTTAALREVLLGLAPRIRAVLAAVAQEVRSVAFFYALVLL
jgi:hypothetical protein